MWKCIFLGWAATLSAQTERERELERRVAALEQRLAALEARGGTTTTTVPAPSRPPVERAALPGGVTVSGFFDGNYSWNFARPFDRVNRLRAYDVMANNFSINQTGIVLERAVDAPAGRRFGLRLDLMYGQATETLQGGAPNEPRPQVYRPVFQAYGTYVAPLGRGLTVDFGKFAGSLGYEGNYTKDQLTYSRAYFFNFLPFYHMGVRSTYAVHDRVSVTHWLVNGAQQTEDFNGFKSNAVLVSVKPARGVSWNLNYYAGREGRAGGGVAPDGRFHVLDTYASWRATARLTLVGEADYVVNRKASGGPPSRVVGGAAYAAYRFSDTWMAATRFEYLDDRHGLFSGAAQALKENTAAVTYQPRDGFQLKAEWRRDYSNRRFFPMQESGRLSARQSTATIGLVWWFGKEGIW